ncbi:class I SAM-dependent methyltransferase [Flavobacterium ardleyense]|uniref:Class I SAM-dependent methyltransferase n=1 Tax=Flavobacterium ardleyense TaxID=2038737 RepID=A0ABW5Z799_9FLAO
MEHDYYKEYYELERNHWWFVAREGILSNYIHRLIEQGKLSSKDLKILNVGCGPGRSSEYLSKFGKVTSIEYDEFCCEFASKKTGLEIINGSITELPFEDNSFDLVCAFDVVEHVEDDQLAVKELKRVTKKGAFVLITVPAFMDLWSHHDVINHHFKRYKIKEVNLLFDTINDGNKVFDTYFNSLLFLPIYFFRKVSNFLKLGQKRKGSGSDFEAFKPGVLNRILYKIMYFESSVINRKIRFPFGVSILYNWKKF